MIYIFETYCQKCSGAEAVSSVMKLGERERKRGERYSLVYKETRNEKTPMCVYFSLLYLCMFSFPKKLRCIVIRVQVYQLQAFSSRFHTLFLHRFTLSKYGFEQNNAFACLQLLSILNKIFKGSYNMSCIVHHK